MLLESIHSILLSAWHLKMRRYKDLLTHEQRKLLIRVCAAYRTASTIALE